MEKLCYNVFCIFLYKKRSFPSYAKRLFRNEAKYVVIDTKIIFIVMQIKLISKERFCT